MYFAQFEAQENISSRISWGIHYDRTVDVEYYYESMDVRGNVLRFDSKTGHLSIEKEFTTYFIVGEGRHESVSEYIIYGTKVIEIVKTLENDRIIFEYIEHKLNRYTVDQKQYANTMKFIEKIPSGTNFPEDGYSGGYWYVAGQGADNPLVYNLKDGKRYAKIVGDFDEIGREDRNIEIRWIAGKSNSNLHFLQWNRDGDFSEGKWLEVRVNSFSNIDGNSYHRKASVPTDSFPAGEEIYLRFMEIDGSNNRTYDIGWVTFDNYDSIEPPKLTSPSEESDVNGKIDKFRITWTIPYSEPDAESVKTIIRARINRADGNTSGWKEFEVYGDVRVWEDEDFSNWLNSYTRNIPSMIELTFKVEDNYGRKSKQSIRHRFYYSPEMFTVDFRFKGPKGEKDGKEVLLVSKGNNKMELKFPLSSSSLYHKKVKAYVVLRNETTGSILERRTEFLDKDNNVFTIVDDEFMDLYDKEINTRDKYSLTISSIRIDDTISSKSQKFDLVIEPVKPTPMKWSYRYIDNKVVITFPREALGKYREEFVVLRYDYGTGSIYEVGRSKKEDIVDYTPHPKGSVYTVISESLNGTFVLQGSKQVFKMSEVPHPEILNMSTGTLTRVRDVVVTDTGRTPVKSLHHMAGRNRRLVEFGTHTDGNLGLSWLVGSLDELHTYLDRFKVNDILHYRDNERRHLYLAIDSISVKESYNKLRWQIDMAAQEVEGLLPSTGIYYDWLGDKHDIFEEEKKGGQTS